MRIESEILNIVAGERLLTLEKPLVGLVNQTSTGLRTPIGALWGEILRTHIVKFSAVEFNKVRIAYTVE